MPFRYPKATKFLSRKIGILLASEIIFITSILVLSIHVTWRSEKWRLLNGHFLVWNLGLFSNTANSNCDGLEQPIFHAICMTVFKQTSGPFKEIENFLCGLPSAILKIEPQYADAAREFVNSCDDAQQIAKVSLFCFVLMLACAVVGALVFISILRFAFKKFQKESRWCYWAAGIGQFITCLLLTVVILLHWFGLNNALPSIFHYVGETPDATPIQKVPNGGAFQIGFYIAGILLLMDLSLAVLILKWVPVIPPEQSVIRKKGKRETTPLVPKASTKESFWAYMPEVFQPDVYVAETAPQVIG